MNHVHHTTGVLSRLATRTPAAPGCSSARCSRALGSVALGLLATGAAAQNCVWSAVGSKGPNEQIRTMLSHDDGSGPMLYVGGYFTTIGGITAHRIARWDGSDWSALVDGDSLGLDASVLALTMHDDGSGEALYVGGTFHTAGPLSARGIARWDGTGWSPLAGSHGDGIGGGSVLALMPFDAGNGPELYVGGTFRKMGGVSVNGLARWDGAEWSGFTTPSGTGFTGGIHALIVHDDGTGPALYVGGDFWFPGPYTSTNIARWDGSTWTEVRPPSKPAVIGTVRVLATGDGPNGPSLYAGGSFGGAGGVVVNHIARWDGAAWHPLSHPLGRGVSDDVRAILLTQTWAGSAVLAGGTFTRVADAIASVGPNQMIINRLAAWDGNTWVPFTSGGVVGSDARIYAMIEHDDGSGPAVYIGGAFSRIGDQPFERLVRMQCTQP